MKKCIIFSIFMILIIALTGCFNLPDEENFILALNNNGADGDELPEELYYNENTVINLPGVGSLTRMGFSFNGWNTEADGSGNAYTTGASFIMPGENVTLYAQWTFNPSSINYRDMVSVIGGTYTHTDTQNYETNSYTHTISGYNIGKYEVTYELWYVVYRWALENGYQFASAGEKGRPGIAGVIPSTDKYEPVVSINWRSAIVWCNAYSELAGYAPVYLDSDEEIIRDSRGTNADDCDNAIWDITVNGYRLPTEGEWQYAASNRGSIPYNFASGATASYSNATATDLAAWYRPNAYIVGVSSSDYGTHAVGTKTVNSLGLYDMSGNTSEWCWDWFATSPTTAQDDYAGPDTGTSRVKRGGSWSSYGQNIIIGSRSGQNPNTESGGLRLTRTP